MDKSEVADQLLKRLRVSYQRALEALEDAREGATGDDARAESKYDTRGLESSYLAAGQAEQADELAEAVTRLEAADFPDFDFDDPIAPGALVEVERDDEIARYLLAPAGGGLSIETEDDEAVIILGPGAPLREALLGKRAGETVTDPPLAILEVF